MRISVVTISFNQCSFLEQAIQSVVRSGYEDLDYIVVDPGSTDGSRDVIERYRTTLSAAILEPDQGPADGLNKGFAHATGEIGYFLNADDLVLPGTFARVAALFGRYPDTDLLFGGGFMMDQEGRAYREVVPPQFSRWRFAYGMFTLFQQGFFFRMPAFRRTKGFNTANRTCWDAELVVDLLATGAKPRVIREPLGAFRLHEQSISGSGRLAGRYQEDRRRLFECLQGRRWTGLDDHVARLGSFCRLLSCPTCLGVWLRDTLDPGSAERRRLACMRR